MLQQIQHWWYHLKSLECEELVTKLTFFFWFCQGLRKQVTLLLHNQIYTDNKRLFLFLIIRHLEGKAEVFSTFSVNGRNNLSHKFIVCWLRLMPKWKWMKTWAAANHIITNTFVVGSTWFFFLYNFSKRWKVDVEY